MKAKKECRLGVGSTAAAAKDFRHIVSRMRARRKVHDAILRATFRGALATVFIACMAIDTAGNILIPAIVAAAALGYAGMYSIINRKATRL